MSARFRLPICLAILGTLASISLGLHGTGSRRAIREDSHLSFRLGEDVPTRSAAAARFLTPARPAALPLHFEANRGQADAEVRFMSHGRGYSTFLTPTEMVMRLSRPASTAASRTAGLATRPQESHSALLRMQFVGANAKAEVLGLDELPGKANYYGGRDPSGWHTGVPIFAQVAYWNLYPGINLRCYGQDGQLEYDVEVAPGADPALVALHFAGADRLAVDPHGDLVVEVAGIQVRQHKPFIYQEVNGSRHEISRHYVIADGQQIGFQIGAYDRSQRLVIDPVLSYSTYFDPVSGIAVDVYGHAYVTGGNDSGVYVTCLDNAGQLVYSTTFGGSGTDFGTGIAVDPYGHAYVTGSTTSPDFPTRNASQPQLGPYGAADRNAFVTCLDNSGQMLYSTYLGGSRDDGGSAIAVDQYGHAYVTGTTYSSDFPTRNAFQPMPPDTLSNAFVTNLGTDGQLLYSTYLGGPSGFGDSGTGIAVDQYGHAYVTGYTHSRAFPTTPNAFQPQFPVRFLGPIGSPFVTSLATDGQPIYSTYLGSSSGGDYSTGIAVDPYGHVYVTGSTTAPDFPTLNAFQASLAGFQNAFVTCLGTDGQPSYSTYLGGSRYDGGSAIAVDQYGHAYVTGQTTSSDFPTRDAIQPQLGPYGTARGNAFVTSLGTDGQPIYSTYLGGSDRDSGYCIAVDQYGIAYVGGLTSSRDFPTVNALQPTFRYGFVAKIALGP